MSEFKILDHGFDPAFDLPPGILPPFLDLQQLVIAAPDGEEFTRTIVTHPGAVAIAAVTDHDELVMIRQYRASIDRMVLELPAGLRDRIDEDVLAVGARELQEETGYTAEHWGVLVQPFFSSLGFTDEQVTILKATGLTAGERSPQGPEERFSEVVLVSDDNVVQLLRDGEIVDAKSIMALMMLWLPRGTTDAS